MSRFLRQAVIAELAATNEHPFDFTFWRSFNDAEWDRALSWLDLSGLALYFWHKMKLVNAGQDLPAHVQIRLASCYEENCLRVESLRQESAALNKLFDGAGVQYAVLKGFAMVPDYCPDPALRTQYDHDYLIQLDSLARAEFLLQRSGYIPKITGDGYHIAYVRPSFEDLASRQPVGLYSAGLERPVELHIALWDPAEEGFSVPLPEDFLARLRKHAWQGTECRALCDEDALIFQVLHTFRHILRNWCRLSTFLEISHCLRRRASDTDFWLRFQDRSRNLRWVPEASTVVFRIAQGLFGGFIPTHVKLQVDPKFSLLLDLWINRYGLAGALANFRDSKSSLFLHREFVADRSAWTRVWRRRLFPLRRPHHIPKVLTDQPARRLGKKWAQSIHGLQRFRFHTLAAAWYAWEYRRWRVLRRIPTLDALKTGRRVQETVDPTDCNSGRSPKSVPMQLNDTWACKD